MSEKLSTSEEDVAKFKNATQEEIDEAHKEANMLRAKTGQKPGHDGIVHPTEREKVLDKKYLVELYHHSMSYADRKADERFYNKRMAESGSEHPELATAADYQKALDEIEELQALAEKDLPTAKQAFINILKGLRGSYHLLNDIYNNVIDSSYTFENFSYVRFQEKMKTAKEQLVDLKELAEKFENKEMSAK